MSSYTLSDEMRDESISQAKQDANERARDTAEYRAYVDARAAENRADSANDETAYAAATTASMDAYRALEKVAKRLHVSMRQLIDSAVFEARARTMAEQAAAEAEASAPAEPTISESPTGFARMSEELFAHDAHRISHAHRHHAGAATAVMPEELTYNSPGARMLQETLANARARQVAAGDPPPVRWTDHTTPEPPYTLRSVETDAATYQNLDDASETARAASVLMPLRSVTVLDRNNRPVVTWSDGASEPAGK